MSLDANGLDPEQQALLASIMGKSSQQGSGSFTTAAASSTTGAAAPAAAPDLGNSSKMLSQAEIDALIASMGGK